MTLIKGVILVSFALLPAAFGASQTPEDTAKPAPPVAAQTPMGAVSGVVTPGSHFVLPAMGGKAYDVDLHPIDDPTKSMGHLTGDASPNTTGVKVDLPSNLIPGLYFFTVADGNHTVIPGSIEVAPDKVKLTSVHPATVYPGSNSGFNFDIIGENFSADPKDDDVTIEGRGSIVQGRAGSAKECEAAEKPCLWVENDRKMHIVDYPAEHYQGPINVGVRVGTVTAADQKPLILARFSGTVVFVLSATVTGILFWIVSFIVGTGLAGNKVGKRKLNLLQTFILDPETNSYSLSKFQLFVFSITFIFGYIYVLLSRWLVQWQFSLPDVPSTIAGLLGISGGTTIASVGLTSSRGSKGAGLQQPTGADLISSGGVVLPDRFQFFVWTIVACGGFIALLIGQDPAKVSDFPEIPSGLLYVMGVSAVGYLGGKATRKPGPVLEYTSVKSPTSPTQSWPTLTIQGQNLASDGRFFIDEKALDNPTDAEKSQYPGLPDKLVTATPQMDASDTNFCTELDIIVVDPSIDLTQGNHTFRIVNRDGQFADIAFSLSQPGITAVYESNNPPPADRPNTLALRATNKSITAVVKGDNLQPGSSVRWRGPASGGSFVDLTPVSGAPADGTQLWVSIVPGTTLGSGQMQVITLKGFVASASVQVIDGTSQNGGQGTGGSGTDGSGTDRSTGGGAGDQGGQGTTGSSQPDPTQQSKADSQQEQASQESTPGAGDSSQPQTDPGASSTADGSSANTGTADGGAAAPAQGPTGASGSGAAAPAAGPAGTGEAGAAAPSQGPGMTGSNP